MASDQTFVEKAAFYALFSNSIEASWSKFLTIFTLLKTGNPIEDGVSIGNRILRSIKVEKMIARRESTTPKVKNTAAVMILRVNPPSSSTGIFGLSTIV